MKRKYDFIFSLGSACLCSQSLRNAGLQFASYPLDWVWGGDMRLRTDLAVSGFAGWFDKADFEARPNPDAFGHDPYFNRKTGLLFPHAFPKSVPIDACYDAVRERMDRQVARFNGRLDASRRVLIVWIGDPRDVKRILEEDVVRCLRRFGERWPAVDFRLLALDCLPDVSPDSPQKREGPGYEIRGFDYRVFDDGAPDWAYRQDLVACCLKGIRARDYRTREEKRRHRAAERAREFERYGVDSAWTCWVAKMKRKIGRHLRRAPYDQVVSLGQWCATSLLLRKLGLRSASGPFDWLLGSSHPVSQYVDLIVTDFKGFLLRENLHRVSEDRAAGHAHYADTASGFEFRHDFGLDESLETAFPRVREKYDRRIARLLADLSAGKRILFVHYRGEGRTTASELSEAMERLRMKFPKATADLLVLETEKGVSGLTTDEINAGVTRVTGDFYDQRRFDAVLGNEALVLKALRRIRLRGRWRNLLHERIRSIKRRLFRWSRRGGVR